MSTSLWLLLYRMHRQPLAEWGLSCTSATHLLSPAALCGALAGLCGTQLCECWD
jgi:hypothetical protein